MDAQNSGNNPVDYIAYVAESRTVDEYAAEQNTRCALNRALSNLPTDVGAFLLNFQPQNLGNYTEHPVSPHRQLRDAHERTKKQRAPKNTP